MTSLSASPRGCRAVLAAALFAILVTFSAVPVHAQSWVPERRKDQFLTEPAYLVIPFPYSLPGLGSGIAFTGLLANIAGTHADAYGIFLVGDIEGSVIAAEDIHIYPRTLILDFAAQNLDRVVFTSYDKRGMDSKQDEYSLIELSRIESQSARATLTFFDRRFEIFGELYKQQITVERVRDSDGNLIADLEEPYRYSYTTTTFGTLFDITDDKQDPRKGFRAFVQRSHRPPGNDTEADFYVWDYSASIYVPVGRQSTWLFNHFRSDAQVIRKGETDENVIRAEIGLNCQPGDSECQSAEQELVDNFVASRKYGSATSLGGDERLRSYPGERYQGAHAAFYATEFRWNLTEEVTPFDYFIWKDVRTSVQIAFFYETGSVADKASDVGDVYRSSYGIGLRLVSASGYLYRVDAANGDEGANVVVIFGYPF